MFKRIADLQGDEYILVEVDIEANDILKDIGKSGFSGLVVKLAPNGAEYAEIWGFNGTPCLEKNAERLYP